VMLRVTQCRKDVQAATNFPLVLLSCCFFMLYPYWWQRELLSRVLAG